MTFTAHIDMIITNAKVLTMRQGQSRAQAVAIAGGKIVALGSRVQVEAMAHSGSNIIDAGGRSLLPGFFESHLHLGLGGAELAHLNLSGIDGFDALKTAFTRYGIENPDSPFLMAQSAHYAMLDHPMSRHDLDKMMPDRPIAMTAHDHHTVWANTAALKAAGLLNGADTPKGHEVVIGADGLATGELREFEAFAPIIALGGERRLNLGISTGQEPSPWPTEAERAIDRAKFLAGLKHCARHGITSMVSMDGNRYTLELLREIEREGNLLARVKVPFHFKPDMGPEQLICAEEMTRHFDDDWLSSGFVKMFMDGVIDSRTAFMLNDYPDQAGHRSEPLFAPQEFNEIASRVDAMGLQMAVHAIGDGAVRTTINGYEAAQIANGKRDSRHRIEHIELIDRHDIVRLGALGIVASLQPTHPPGAMDFDLEPSLSVIGKGRWADAFLWKTLADHGTPIAYSSDWPVTDVSIMRGLQASLTRTPYDATCGDECLSRYESLHAYTAGGAWAAHREAVTGHLKPGLAADLVLIDGNIETTPTGQLGQVPIALTIAGGRITYDPKGQD
jgi:predicted amidohydrolase YtcJ